MKRVVIESPFAHDKDDLVARERVWRYVRAAMHDCLMRGEAPYASHALYTQPGVLSDWDRTERALGIAAGFAWGEVAELRVFYKDLGVTSGMLKGIEEAKRLGQPYEERMIPGWEETA